MVAFKSYEDSEVQWLFVSVLDSVYLNEWSEIYCFNTTKNFWLQVRLAKEDFLK
jgi:hypothetical protein